MPTHLAGGSNITISDRFRSAPNVVPSVAPGGLNLGPPPGSGGAIVKVQPQSQALIPRVKPSLPAYEPPPFAEPPRAPQQIYLTQQPTLNPRPVANLADIPKPIPNLPKTPLTTPKNAPVVAVPNKSGILQIVPPRGGVTNALVTVAAEVIIHDVKELVKLYKLSQPETQAKEGLPEGAYKIGYTIESDGNFYNYEKLAATPDEIYYTPIRFLGEAVEPSSNKTGWQFEYTNADGETKIGWANLLGFPGRGALEKWPISNIKYQKVDPVTKENIPTPPQDLEPQRQRSPVASRIGPDALPQFLDPPAPRQKLDIVPNFAPPPADKPLESNKRIPVTITTPGASPITISAPGQSPVTISPSGSPATIKITRPAAIPTAAPSSTPGSTPTSTPAPVPIAVSSPGSTPTTLTMPGAGPITISTPGQEPITFDPTTGKPTGVQSDPNQKPSAYVSTPDPTTDPTTTPTTPTTPTSPLTTPAPKDLPGIGLALVGITQLLQGIAPQVTPTAIASAVCETTKPSGCTTGAINKGVSKGNEDLKQFLTNQLPNIIGSGANAAIGLDTNARVKKVEADTAKIRESTGSDRYPMVLPEYLLDDFIDKPVQIPDQVAYNVWLLKQIDALVGLFPIKIERIDENGSKQLLKFENIAEAISELTGLLAQIAFDADTAVNVSTRATGEAVGAKAAALQAGSYLKAITDYMGFQGQAVSIDVPISVTPGAVGLDGKLQESELKDFLKPSIQKTIGFKNTDPVDQRLVMRRILESGEISRAALFKPLKTDPTQNPLTGDAIKADKSAELKRINDLWEAFKLRMEGHTAGTKVDIDDGVKPEDTTP